MKNRNKNQGFSLMEMLITIAIFILAIFGITIMVQMSYHYYNFIFNQAEIVNNTQKTLKEMSQEIREMRQADNGGFNVERAAANEIIIFSNIDETSDVERVRYYKEGDCLKKGIVKPTGTPVVYNLATEEISNVSCNITNAGEEPLFAYYSGYPSTSSLLPGPVDPHLIRIVKIYLRVSSTGLKPIPMSKVITDYVRPRNVNRESH